MPEKSVPWIATVFLFEGKIYVWVNVQTPSDVPGKVEVIDHLTQRADEADAHYFWRVNQFVRAEAARRGAEISVTLEPESVPISH